MTTERQERKVKIGFIGAGFIGQVAHLANYKEIPGAEVVALAELRPELGELVCRRYDIPRYYESHTALLEDPDIDAVVAVVRRHHTGPVGLDVLNAGKHLFTEKPMAATHKQGQRLVSAAAERDLRYGVGFMRRYDEGVQAAKAMLDELQESDELGPVRYVRVYCFAGGDYCNISGHLDTYETKPTNVVWPIAPDFVPENMQREYEHFLNVASHDVNLLRYMFPMPTKVTHAQWKRPAGSTILFDLGEFPAVLEYCDIQQNRWEEGMEIHFAKGKMTIDLPPAFLKNHPAKVELYKDNGKDIGQVIRPTPDWTWAFKREDEAFVRDVANGTEPLANGADSLGDMELIEEVWRYLV